MHSFRFRLACLPLLCLLLTLASCSGTSIVYQDTEVQSRAQRTAAQAIRTGDIVAASVVKFMVAGHQQGTIPTAVLQTYDTDVGPAVQAALDTARNGLQRAIDTPSADTTQQLLAQLETLMEVLNKAVTLAQQYGF